MRCSCHNVINSISIISCSSLEFSNNSNRNSSNIIFSRCNSTL